MTGSPGPGDMYEARMTDSPGFSAPFEVDLGEVVERGGLVFCDLLAC